MLGGDQWGTLRISHARHFTQYRLGIYPPGITDEQRRAIKIWHGASMWATTLWLVIMITVTAGGVHPLLSALGSALVAGGAAFVAAEHSQPVRGEMHWLEACTGDYPSEPSHQQFQRDRILRLTALLRAADKAVATGGISPIEHKALWARCYRDLAPHRGEKQNR